MDAQQIKVFIDAMAASGLAEMEARKDGRTLRLVRGGVTPAAPATCDAAAPRDRAGAYDLCAAMAGVVFLQPAPGDQPFVSTGQAVRAGQVLCVIEAMKVFNEVHAERDGIVEAFLVASGQEIDAGQPLVRLR